MDVILLPFTPFSTHLRLPPGLLECRPGDERVSRLLVGPRISGRNSAVSSKPQRSGYSASASHWTVQPVRHEYRAASRVA
jgi:hypothetical protein